VTLSDRNLRFLPYVKCSAKGELAVKVKAFLFSQSKYLASLLLLNSNDRNFVYILLWLNNYNVLKPINIPTQTNKQTNTYSKTASKQCLKERKAPSDNSRAGGRTMTLLKFGRHKVTLGGELRQPALAQPVCSVTGGIPGEGGFNPPPPPHSQRTQKKTKKKKKEKK